MKLAQTTAPNTSEVRLPSMKPNTSPQIMPSGRPFKNMAATFHGAGTSANSTSAHPGQQNQDDDRGCALRRDRVQRSP